MMAGRKWEGRWLSEERLLAFRRILEGVAYVDIAKEVNCFLYRQFGTQRQRVSAPAMRSPLRLSPAEREEISRGLQ